MKKLFLEAHRSDPVYDRKREEVSSECVRRWQTIESVEDVRFGMIDDELQTQKSPNYLNNNYQHISADEGLEPPPRRLPSAPTILETFEDW